MRSRTKITSIILIVCMLLLGTYPISLTEVQNKSMSGIASQHSTKSFENDEDVSGNDFTGTDARIIGCSKAEKSDALIFESAAPLSIPDVIRVGKRKTGNGLERILRSVLNGLVPVFCILFLALSITSLYLLWGWIVKRFLIIGYIHNQDGKKPRFLMI